MLSTGSTRSEILCRVVCRLCHILTEMLQLRFTKNLILGVFMTTGCGTKTKTITLMELMPSIYWEGNYVTNCVMSNDMINWWCITKANIHRILPISIWILVIYMNLNNNEGYINMESFENFWTTSIPQYHFQIRIQYVTHIQYSGENML